MKTIWLRTASVTFVRTGILRRTRYVAILCLLIGVVRSGVPDLFLNEAMRAGSWKFIDKPDGTRFLFDLSTDPSESNDLAADHPERCAEFQRQLDAWEAQFPPSNPPASQAQRKS